MSNIHLILKISSPGTQISQNIINRTFGSKDITHTMLAISSHENVLLARNFYENMHESFFISIPFSDSKFELLKNMFEICHITLNETFM